MKILLFGNVGCGKSTLSMEVLKMHNDFNLLSVDDFRRKFGDGTMEKERLAKENFIKAIDSGFLNQIIECSGLGDTGEMVFQRLSNTKDVIIVFVLLVNSEICIERLSHRVWDIPYPEKLSNVNKLIESQELIYKKDTLKNKWDNFINVIYISGHNATLEEFQINFQKLNNLINETKRNN
jgi:hypothetical protein